MHVERFTNQHDILRDNPDYAALWEGVDPRDPLYPKVVGIIVGMAGEIVQADYVLQETRIEEVINQHHKHDRIPHSMGELLNYCGRGLHSRSLPDAIGFLATWGGRNENHVIRPDELLVFDTVNGLPSVRISDHSSSGDTGRLTCSLYPNRSTLEELPSLVISEGRRVYMPFDQGKENIRFQTNVVQAEEVLLGAANSPVQTLGLMGLHLAESAREGHFMPLTYSLLGRQND